MYTKKTANLFTVEISTNFFGFAVFFSVISKNLTFLHIRNTVKNLTYIKN